jgi:hypothetical protein
LNVHEDEVGLSSVAYVVDETAERGFELTDQRLESSF